MTLSTTRVSMGRGVNPITSEIMPFFGVDLGGGGVEKSACVKYVNKTRLDLTPQKLL